uniref:RING-type domain-containing protein n=1 Tax=Strongyloides papillosus TaxID=174720 RepID=A0A0N5BFC9_STREA
MNDSSQFNCEICFQSYTQVGSLHSIACLPCGHIFGKNCLFQWLESKKPQVICPKCKKKFNGPPHSKDKFEDYIITIYGLPSNGDIPVEYEDFSDKLFQVKRELLEVKEENSKLKRELDSLRKNFRYLSSQQSIRNSLFSSYTNFNNFSNIGNRLRSYRPNSTNPSIIPGVHLNTRQRRGIIFDYLSRFANVPFGGSTSNRYTDSVVSNPPSPNNIPEFIISDEGEHTEEQITDENPRDTIPLEPDEIVIVSDDEESISEANNVEFQEFNIFNELGNDYPNELSSSNVAAVSFTNCIYSLKCENITDAVLVDETVISACKLSTEDNSLVSYGLKFFSSKGNYILRFSSEPINGIDVVKSRNNSNRFNILVASSRNLYFVKFHAFDFNAVVSKILNHTVEITSLAWLSHEQFAFGTSDGKVIFGGIGTHIDIYRSRKRPLADGVSESKTPIVQLRGATHGNVFGVQGNKIYLYHRDSKKSLIKEYDTDVKFIDMNGNKDKLFCFLTDGSQTLKVVPYMIVEHIRTQRTHLNVEDNLLSQEYQYNTNCIKMKSSIFEYANQHDSFVGLFDYDKNSSQLLVRFFNRNHDGKLSLQIREEPLKVVVNILSNKITGGETLKFAIITSEDIHVYGLNCNF